MGDTNIIQHFINLARDTFNTAEKDKKGCRTADHDLQAASIIFACPGSKEPCQRDVPENSQLRLLHRDWLK